MLHLTAKNFLAEAKHSPMPVVVMFYAVWCGKCAMMKPIVEDVEEIFRNKIKFCEVEIGESAVLAAEYDADDIVPTFVFFQDDICLGSIKGTMEQSTFCRQLREIFGVS